MKEATNNERLAIVETEMRSVKEKMGRIEESLGALHGKFDLLTQTYVAKETFEEYKKNRWLERIVVILVTAIISGLVTFVLREKGI